MSVAPSPSPINHLALYQRAELVVRCPVLGYSLTARNDVAGLGKLEAHAFRRALAEINSEFRRDQLKRLRWSQAAFHRCAMTLHLAGHQQYMESLGAYSRTVQA
jgi:hypothetical protein